MPANTRHADPLRDLNPRQLEAVTTVDGPLVIVAGPGSGKTRVITHRIAHLVQHGKVPPYRIGAVTFTNRAAREMRERLFGRSEDDPGAPLLGWGIRGRGLMVSTFHSFCAQVLRQEAETLKLRRDFVIYDDADQMAVVKTAMAEVNVDPKKFNPRSVLSAISDAKSRLVSVDAFGAGKGSYWDEIVHRTYERYEQVLHGNSALDFDDLLVKAHTLLRDVPEVARSYQERYVHFMVDEFQDTNVAQYAIARQISQLHRNLCVVGDPDQSIYSWRSADVRNLQSFRDDFPEAKVVVLEENYRSTQTILDAASGVIASNEGRVEKKLWTKKDGGAPLVVMDAYDERDEAQLVLRESERLVRQEDHDRGDIAVMYRVNAQSRAFEDACARYGVPYQLVGGLRFYQRQEVKDIVAYLRLIANPDDDVSFERVVNVPSRGIGKRTMEKLAGAARDQGVSMFTATDGVSAGGGLGTLQPRAVRALTGFRDMIIGLRDGREEQDLAALIDSVLEKTGYLKHAAQDEERGEERLENLEELKATAGEFGDSDEGEALTAFLERVSLVSDTDDLEDNRDRITLITLHQAKGLEFRVVFMVGMEEGLLPHIRSLDDPKEMEEERRLAYVGRDESEGATLPEPRGAARIQGRLRPERAVALPGRHSRKARRQDFLGSLDRLRHPMEPDGRRDDSQAARGRSPAGREWCPVGVKAHSTSTQGKPSISQTSGSARSPARPLDRRQGPPREVRRGHSDGHKTVRTGRRSNGRIRRQPGSQAPAPELREAPEGRVASPYALADDAARAQRPRRRHRRYA